MLSQLVDLFNKKINTSFKSGVDTDMFLFIT